MPRNPFPALPSAPLAMAMERIERQRQDRGYKEHMATLCKSAGISDRTWREWQMGARQTVLFNTADRVLTLLGLLWWEVWNEQTTRRHAIVAVTYGQRKCRGELRREVVGVRRYGDQGPDRVTLVSVKKTFTGCEHEGLHACDECEARWLEEEIQMELAA